MSKEIHFNAAQVIVSPDLIVVRDKDVPNVIAGIQLARVITVNGQIWDKYFQPWGLDPASAHADWDLRQLSTWTRFDPNQQPIPTASPNA